MLYQVYQDAYEENGIVVFLAANNAGAGIEKMLQEVESMYPLPDGWQWKYNGPSPFGDEALHYFHTVPNGYARRLRMLTAAYKSGAAVSDETRRRIGEHADSHSSVHPAVMTADPLTLTAEERCMAGGKTLAKLRK